MWTFDMLSPLKISPNTTRNISGNPRQQRRVPWPRRQPEQAHAATVGLAEPLDHLQRRGLGGAVGAEDPEELALLDGDRHPVDGDQVSVALGQVLHDDRGVDRLDDVIWEIAIQKKKSSRVSATVVPTNPRRSP